MRLPLETPNFSLLFCFSFGCWPIGFVAILLYDLIWLLMFEIFVWEWFYFCLVIDDFIYVWECFSCTPPTTLIQKFFTRFFFSFNDINGICKCSISEDGIHRDRLEWMIIIVFFFFAFIINLLRLNQIFISNRNEYGNLSSIKECVMIMNSSDGNVQ